jgi:hypothetical protein
MISGYNIKMRDIDNNILNIGDYFFLAAKASVSHVLKLGLIIEISEDFVYYVCIENDWRGFKLSRKQKIRHTEGTTFKIENPLIINKAQDVFHNNQQIIRELNKDFLNNELELGSDYLIAKHDKNQSRLVKATCIDITESLVYFRDINDNIIKTKNRGRIVKI